MYLSAIVRKIARTSFESGKRLGLLAAVILLAACDTKVGSAAVATPPHAIETASAASRLAPTVVSVSPGATIEWGFAVATAGMLETHEQFADGRARTR